MTNLDLDDADDPRIRLVRRALQPADFPASAGEICRDRADRHHRRRAGHGLLEPDPRRRRRSCSTTYQGDPAGRDYDDFDCSIQARRMAA